MKIGRRIPIYKAPVIPAERSARNVQDIMDIFSPAMKRKSVISELTAGVPMWIQLAGVVLMAIVLAIPILVLLTI